jgi:hypothetical protein
VEHPRLDGIIYPSVQFGGSDDRSNVVLFHEAAQVQLLDVPTNAIIDVVGTSSLGDFFLAEAPYPSDDPPSPIDIRDDLNDQPDVRYMVFEEVGDPAPQPTPDDASPTLRFAAFLELYHICSVRFDHVSSPVYRKPIPPIVPNMSKLGYLTGLMRAATAPGNEAQGEESHSEGQ